MNDEHKAVQGYGKVIALFYGGFIILSSIIGGGLGLLKSYGCITLAIFGLLAGFGVGVALGLLTNAVILLYVEIKNRHNSV